MAPVWVYENPGSERLFFMFSPVTGQTRPILLGLHKSKQEDSKGERQEERVREAHREKSGDLGGSWGYFGGILGGSGGDLGVWREQRIRRAVQNLLPLQQT